jgi:hypothetical protein
VIGHQRWLWERARDEHLGQEQEAELEELRGLMLRRESLLSGRTLWLGGTPVAQSRESSNFNCTGLKIETVHDVVDAMWLLLQGCGVGFEPTRGSLSGFTVKKEVIVVRSEITREQWDAGKRGQEENYEYFHGDTWTIQVGDSAEAWAKAVGKLLAGKNNAKTLVLDFSQIRPAGIRLKGYGWISSGDETFYKALTAIANILNRRTDQMLSRMDVHDIMTHLGTTLSSRRSAEISLVPFGDIEWEEFAMCKKDSWANGNAHRGQSNNSLVFYQRPSKLELRAIFDMIREGLGSEPGFVNGEAAQRRAPFWKITNPCCFRGDQLVHTRQGDFCIEDLVGRTVDVWDGNQWQSCDNFRVLGTNEWTHTVTLHDGSEIVATDYHDFILSDGTKVQLKDLRVGDELQEHTAPEAHGTHDEPGAYLKGFLLGDGTSTANGRAALHVYEPKRMCMDRLVESARELLPTDMTGANLVVEPGFGDFISSGKANMRGLAPRRAELYPWVTTHRERLPKEIFAWSFSAKADFLAGFFDADGTASDTRNGFMYQCASVHREMLQDIQALLKTLGVRSKLSLMHSAGTTDFGTERGGECETQAIWRLTVSQAASIVFAKKVVFSRLVSFAGKISKYQVRSKHSQIACIEPASAEDEVFCCTVPSTSSFALTGGQQVGNCEISLPNKGMCNLVTTDLGKFNGRLEALHRAIHIISRANYRQTCVNLHDGVLQGAWHEQNEFLRLCGVSLTGFVTWEHQDSPDKIRVLRVAAQSGVDSMATELGLPKSKAVTTCKPEGTASKILDTTEGCHKPLGRFIINKIKFGTHDPLLPILREANYRMMPDPYDNTGMLVDFPVDFSGVEFTKVTLDDGRVVEVNTESAIDQLERYKLLMENYVTEHNVSNTISYDPSEVPAMIDWIYENWDHYVGVSFLYRNDPTKTAEDLGYPYLPQQVVTEEEYSAYALQLKPFDLNAGNTLEELRDEGCSTGACPVK